MPGADSGYAAWRFVTIAPDASTLSGSLGIEDFRKVAFCISGRKTARPCDPDDTDIRHDNEPHP
jgi:hypothetical protein